MRLVYVSGNIASGKSTLIEMLATLDGWHRIEEVDQPIRYLDDLFSKPERWALESQLAFLGNKIALLRNLPDVEGWALIDRSPYEHAEVFARHFHETGALDDRAYATYSQVYDLLMTSTPVPVAVVLCACPPALCEERMRARRRPFDDLYPPRHVYALDRLFRHWMTSFRSAPLYALDTQANDVRAPEVALGVSRDLERAARPDRPPRQLEVLAALR